MQTLIAIAWATCGPMPVDPVDDFGAPISLPWDYSAFPPLPAAPVAVPEGLAKTTAEESFDVLSRQHLAKLGLTLPVTTAAGTLAFNTQEQGVLAPPDAAVFRTIGAFPTVDRVSGRVGIRWQDERKDQLDASLGTRYDVIQARPGANDVAVSLKTMLPEPLLSWYVQGEASADSQQTEQVTLSLGSSWDLSNGSRVTSSLSMSKRDNRKRARQQSGSTVLNWATEWKRDDRLGIGIRINYYLDARDMDAMMFLEVKGR
jgi:hypothetical protein